MSVKNLLKLAKGKQWKTCDKCGADNTKCHTCFFPNELNDEIQLAISEREWGD